MNVKKISNIWRHTKTGARYQLLWIANTCADLERKEEYPDTAVYRRLSDGTIWARKLESWNQSFMNEGELGEKVAF